MDIKLSVILFLIICMTVLVSNTGVFAQTEITLLPSIDNTLYEDTEGDLSNGKGDYLFVGATAPKNSGLLRRALVQFDIAGNIPADAVIQSATFSMYMNKTIAGDQNITLHRVEAAWGEGNSNASGSEGQGASSSTGDATWIHRIFDTELWTEAGGDFLNNESAAQTVGNNGSYTWGSTSQMVNDIQFWLDSPSQNFGWIIIGNESTTTTAKRFASREHSTENNRPTLTIVYTEPTNILSPNKNTPKLFKLNQNHPNPFNPQTIISYYLPVSTVKVTLEIFNIKSQKVRTLINTQQGAGIHSLEWDGYDDHGKALAGGIYIYQLKAGTFQDRKKMILLK